MLGLCWFDPLSSNDRLAVCAFEWWGCPKPSTHSHTPLNNPFDDYNMYKPMNLVIEHSYGKWPICRWFFPANMLLRDSYVSLSNEIWWQMPLCCQLSGNLQTQAMLLKFRVLRSDDFAVSKTCSKFKMHRSIYVIKNSCYSAIPSLIK